VAGPEGRRPGTSSTGIILTRRRLHPSGARARIPTETVMDRVPEWVVFAPVLAVAAAVTLWVAGAIYYDVYGAGRWGRLAAVAWVVGVAALFALWRPPWQPFAALLGATALFLAWWLRLKPSHDREWEPTVAVLPRAIRDGDAAASRPTLCNRWIHWQSRRSVLGRPRNWWV